MAKSSHHVVPSPSGGWSVKKSGSARASKKFDSQTAAVDYAKEVSKNSHSDLIVHRKDGTIQSRDSLVKSTRTSRTLKPSKTSKR